MGAGLTPHVKLGIQLAMRPQGLGAAAVERRRAALAGRRPRPAMDGYSCSALPFDPAAKWHTPLALDASGLRK
jgi:hypothetical protein